MRKVILHNPCNEHTRYYRNYNLFWDDLTDKLKKRYDVTENRYFEFANSQRFKVNLKKGTSNDFLLMECEYVIEFEDSGDFYVLSVSDDFSHAVLNEQSNPHLKKVLFSQFHRNSVNAHVREENLDKYSPWIYFPSGIDDLNCYFEKRQSISNYQDKMFFRGTSLEDRSILKHIDRNYLQGINTIGGWEPYFNDLINHKVGLSVAGRGEICYRDIEYMAVGVPFIRFEYTSDLNPNLIPNYHYVSVNRPNDLIKDRLGNESHAKMIVDRFLEVKDDEDFLNFISNNAKLYYETYLKRYNNVLHTLKLLNL